MKHSSPIPFALPSRSWTPVQVDIDNRLRSVKSCNSSQVCSRLLSTSSSEDCSSDDNTNAIMSSSQCHGESAITVQRRTRVRKYSQQVPVFFNYLLVLFFVTSLMPWAEATISVVSEITNETVVQFSDLPARFVPDRVSFYGIQGYMLYADPPNACENLKPPPTFPGIDYPINWILLARRYDCSFQKKILNAQSTGYAAIVIHNVGSNGTEAMGVEDSSKIAIYACFIGEYHGEILRDNFTFPKGYYIRIQDDFSLNGYLLPFAIVVGICFVVMLLFMVRLLWQQVIRWIRERRRSRRRKLPAWALKKLPVQKWTKGDPYETCAVCLEDFVEHDKVRILPCSHGFHMVCIDPWLTKGRRVCPICKRKVVLADEHFSDSDTDTDDETAPLLGTSSASTAQNTASGGSTFVQQRENPFRRAQRRLQERRSQRAAHDSDTTSTTSSEDSFVGDVSHSSRSCPVLAEVHQTGRRRRVADSPPNDDAHHLHRCRREHSHSHQSLLSCQDSQCSGGEDNAMYVPDSAAEDDKADGYSLADEGLEASAHPDDVYVVDPHSGDNSSFTTTDASSISSRQKTTNAIV